LVFFIEVGQDFQPPAFMDRSVNEIDLKFQYCDPWRKAIRLVSAGIIDLKPLITHRFRLEDALEAFEVASNITSGSIKVQVLG
jgi:L-iditol 2-dehydrogenase